MFTDRVRTSLARELSGMMISKILEIPEIDDPAVAGIAIRDAREVVLLDDADREAGLQGKIQEDGLEASPDLGEIITARSLDLGPADAAQIEATVVTDHDPLSEDVQDRTHVRDDVQGLSLVCNPPRNPKRESGRDHRAGDHEAPTEALSELAPNLPYPRTGSNDHPHISMPKKKRRGNRSKLLRARKRLRPILPRRRKPVQRVSLCLVSTLILTNAASAANVPP